jgi:hypothetical protein
VSCRFEIHARPNRKNDVVWAARIQDVDPIPTVKHPLSLNVAGGVSSAGKVPLYIFNERMDAELYERILRNSLLPGGNKLFSGGDWVLVHDRDPKHTSHRVLHFLDTQHPQHLTYEWPASSPDLNPIENVWSQLATAVRSQQPTTLSHLRAAIRRAWRRLPLESVIASINSMPERLKEVIAKHGGHTSY